MRLLVPILCIAALLSACGSEKPKATAKAPQKVESQMARDLPDGVKPSAQVIKERTVAGKWRSAKGVLKDQPDALVQMEIADDQSWLMTLRVPGNGPVYASLQGRAGWTGGGLSGSASKPKPSPLLPFSTWSADPPSKGAMSIVPVTTKGAAIELVYAGR